MNASSQKVAIRITGQLREYMKSADIEAFILPSHDEFRSEMPPTRNNRLAALTGFTGSYGVAILCCDRAFLATDGRYRLQSKEELPEGLYVAVDVADKKPAQLLAENLPQGARIGYDPELTSKNEYDAYVAAAPHCTFVPLDENPVDAVWLERPDASEIKAFSYPERYAGEGAGVRLSKLARVMEKARADYFFEAIPEHICRLINVRGGDAPFTPVVFGRLLAEKDGTAEWFTDLSRIPEDVIATLQDNGVKTRDISQCISALKALPEKARVIFDPAAISMKHFSALSHISPIFAPSPCAMMQAVKTDSEIRAMREAHKIDGLAVTRFLFWLESARRADKAVSETDIVAALQHFRSMSEEYRGDSFSAIAGIDGNGAIVHYRPATETAANIRNNSMILIDSGGQYLQGTTDITRTLSLFEPTPEQKRHYTLVLRGHIALARATFPEGTHGEMLDALARQYLWREGKDYAHGTGHGVGCFLGVHEGPQRIGKGLSSVGLKPNMALSNEPGYYEDGEYGIRIENVVVVENAPALSDNAPYCRFRTITLAPIDARPIDFALLNAGEKKWLADYHARILKAHGEKLNAEEKNWLEE